MKRWICAVLVLLMMCGMVYAEQENGNHRYKLFPPAEGFENYRCMCNAHVECDEVFPVYPAEIEVELPAATEGETCNHLFRRAVSPKRVSIEPEGVCADVHESATWYDCTCERCGITFEAYTTDGRYYEHVYTQWEGKHIEGEMKHLYISHCDICSTLHYEIVNCAQYDVAECMDTYSTLFNRLKK